MRKYIACLIDLGGDGLIPIAIEATREDAYKLARLRCIAQDILVGVLSVRDCSDAVSPEELEHMARMLDHAFETFAREKAAKREAAAKAENKPADVIDLATFRAKGHG